MSRWAVAALVAASVLELSACVRVDEDSEEPAFDVVDSTVADEISSIGGADEDALLDATEPSPRAVAPTLVANSAARPKITGTPKTAPTPAPTLNPTPQPTAAPTPCPTQAKLPCTYEKPTIDPSMPPVKAELLAEKAEEVAAQKQEAFKKIEAEVKAVMAELPPAQYKARKLVEEAEYQHSRAAAQQRLYEHAQLVAEAKEREFAASRARLHKIDPSKAKKAAAASLIKADDKVALTIKAYDEAEDAKSKAKLKLKATHEAAQTAEKARDAALKDAEVLGTAGGFYQWENAQEKSSSDKKDCKEQAKETAQAYDKAREQAATKAAAANQAFTKAQSDVQAQEKAFDAAASKAAEKLSEMQAAKLLRDAAVKVTDIAERPFNPPVLAVPSVPELAYAQRQARQRAKDAQKVYEHMTPCEKDCIQLRAER